MPDWSDVPLLYQAQIEGRCQLQRQENKQKSPAYDWVDQWTKLYHSADDSGGRSGQPDNSNQWRRNLSPVNRNNLSEPPQFSEEAKTRPYTMTWRLVTNGGQDDGIIRPAIGARGYPYYPGSSMKGAFRRACACTTEQALKYCGKPSQGDQGSEPGILRFLGGYPTDNNWTRNLVDIAHPQQEKQVIQDGKTNANVLLSFHEVTLNFGISSTIPLDEQEWRTIWQIWEKAIGNGLGSRVSAGYGRFKDVTSPETLLQVHLKGQGIAATLLDKTPEFRPNMFKAALRGHTLRLLGGMTDEETAKHLTQILWGGIDGAAILGQLGISFTHHDDDLKFDKHRYTPPGKSEQIMPLYNLKRGTLQISCMNRRTSPEKRQELAELAKAIVQFSLLLGGFGKSWRRADHWQFFHPYFKKGNKPMIGCHWKFIDSSESLYLPITDLQQDLSQFIDRLRTLFQNYAAKQGYTIYPDNPVHCDWREAWYPYDNQGGVQVWGRIVEDRIKAIKWFHQPYEGTHTLRNLQGSIGRDSQTGRLWHRIYPYYQLNSEGKLQRQKPPIELLTFFPETTEDSADFIAFLNERSDFVKIW